MSKPIGIRYYQLFNEGVAIIIWHQLVGLNGTVVWDTRYQGGNADSINITHSQVLDLATTSLSGEVFYLSQDTYWGTDFADKSQTFTYDPNSNLMASATRTGSVRLGALTFQGTKEHAAFSSFAAPVATPSASLVFAGAAEETLRQLGILGVAGRKSCSGTVSWQDVDLAASGLVTIMIHLGSKGYKLNYKGSGTTTTTIEFGFDDNSSSGDVPDNVRNDWNDALRKASEYGLTDAPLALIDAPLALTE